MPTAIFVCLLPKKWVLSGNFMDFFEKIKGFLIKFWSKDLNVKIVFFVVIVGVAVWLGPFLDANDPDYFW